MKTLIFRTAALTAFAGLLIQICAPIALHALTSGPVQQEFAGFEPVATTSMVNEFTGGFTYNLPIINIPGANGGGYAMSLSYHSGVTPEQEASWVGYGWTLNPGSIVRGTRGFPDDYHNADVRYVNKTKANWTAAVGITAGTELASGNINLPVPVLEEIDIPVELNLSANYSLRLNSYKGFGYVLGFSAQALGMANYGYSLSDGKETYNHEINPGGLLLGTTLDKVGPAQVMVGSRIVNRGELKWADKSRSSLRQAANQAFSFYVNNEIEDNERPVNIEPYSGASIDYSYGGKWELLPFAGVEATLQGSFNYHKMESEKRKAWGYMYSGTAVENTDDLMDYYLEKDVPYTIRDNFLAIPFSNFDNFALTGEGLGGGFRLHHSRVGHFRPNQKSSSVSMQHHSREWGAGASSWSNGFDGGIGEQKSEFGEWPERHVNNNTNTGIKYDYAKNSTASSCSYVDEPYFFRFNNDLGGSVEASPSDHFIGMRNNFIPVDARHNINDNQRSGRSSHIASTRNVDVLAGKGYTQQAALKSYGARALAPEGIGEFAVTNEQGVRYVYGMPVYAAAEENMQFGNRLYTEENAPLLEPDSDRYLAKFTGSPIPNTSSTATYVVGEMRNQPYASSYMLTEITSNDFLDIDGDGPDDDDLGGYVRFDYDVIHGNVYSKDKQVLKDNWYRWRNPYNGMQYDIADMSEPDDNKGLVRSGYKQIVYLDEIETKTHIAKFHRSDRDDGLSATTSTVDALSNTTGIRGGKKLQQLDKIELFAKADLNNPIRTIHFEYEQTVAKHLAGGVHNNSVPTGGKLTLKKVWIEYEGIVNTRITPYVFGYEYRSPDYYKQGLSGTLIEEKYGDVISHGSPYSSANQNPDYDPCNIDAWGAYQANGGERRKRMQSWVNQNPSADFDPAAWHLKWIRLPSGGEIHVQYEQHDYSFVQDRRAMAMLPLISNNPDLNRNDHLVRTRKFYLDVGGWQPSLTAAQRKQLIGEIADQIRTDYLGENGSRELHFRFLYSLFDSGLIPDVEDTELKAEYITGYSAVKDAGFDDPDPGVDGDELLWVTLEHAPRNICLDRVEANKAGRLEYEDFKNFINENNYAEALTEFLSNFGRTFFDEEKSCRRIALADSYLRVPITVPKKGGGVRVKRLLMFDPGLDGDGTANLFGSRYRYEMYDDELKRHISSGVAANEPVGMREENALVTSLKKRAGQSSKQRATAGEDKKQFEGPLGESILPSPSVGYARVVVENIHSGLNGAGFVVHEFYTARDFPFDGHYQELSRDGITYSKVERPKDRLLVPLALYNSTSEEIIQRQGYTFILNNMHGQVRSVSTYSGDFDDPATHVLSAQQCYNYFEPGERVPMFYGPAKALRMEQPGKEMEVVFESRYVDDFTWDFGVEVDLSFVQAIVVSGPYPTVWPTLKNNRTESKIYVNSKVIRYPAILKSVTSFKDGIFHTTENVAFDPATGRPAITRTTDGYDDLTLGGAPAKHVGAYYAYSLPAYRSYPALAQKAMYEGKIIYANDEPGEADRGLTLSYTDAGPGGTLNIVDGSTGGGYAAMALEDVLIPGDIVELRSASAASGTYQISAIDFPNKNLSLTDHGPNLLSGNHPVINSLRIVRSARQNNLLAAEGSVVTYGEDLSAALAWGAELQRRQKMADHLNNYLFRCQQMALQHFDMPAKPYTEYPDLKINWPKLLGATSETGKLNEKFGLFFGLIDNKTINIRSRKLVCDSPDPHPYVGELNKLLNDTWGSTLATLGGLPIVPGCTNPLYEQGYAMTSATVTTAEASIQASIDAFMASITDECLVGNVTNGGQALKTLRASLLPRYEPSDVALLAPNDAAIALVKDQAPRDAKLASLKLFTASGGLPILQSYARFVETTCTIHYSFLPDSKANLRKKEQPEDDFRGTLTSIQFDQLFDVASDPDFFTNNIGYFDQDEKGYLTFTFKFGKANPNDYVVYRYDYQFARSVFDSGATTFKDVQIKKSRTGPGRFAINDNGQIVYYREGSNVPVDLSDSILEFTNEGFTPTMAGPDLNKVLSAGAVTWSDDWDFEWSDYSAASEPANPYAAGKRGKWRPKETYAYRTDVGTYASGESNIYEMGTFATFSLFDKDNPGADANWLRVNRVTAYSPHGEALEELNILDIPSAAKFGHDGKLPVLLAQNAEKGAVAFMSYEDLPVTTGVIKDDHAHTGKQSLAFTASGTADVATIRMTQRLHDAGIQVKFWVRNDAFAPLSGATATIYSGLQSANTSASQVARTGEWALYEAKVRPSGWTGLPVDATVEIGIAGPNGSMRLDDVRIQPLDAQMTTYVYDNRTLRVLAVFDDQHFGLMYQYDEEGKLVRRLRETERGIKTVQEAQYHTPPVERSAEFLGILGAPSGGRLQDAARPADEGLLPGLLRAPSGAQGGQNSGGQFKLDRSLSLPDSLMPDLNNSVDTINSSFRSLQPERNNDR